MQDEFGLGAYTNIGPPLTQPSGFPGPGYPVNPWMPAGMNPNMAPNGLPWAANPPTMLVNPYANMVNPLIGKVNTGSVTYPEPPQTPVNNQNQPTGGGNPQPPSDSA